MITYHFFKGVNKMRSGIKVTCSFMMNCDAIIRINVRNTTSYWRFYFYSVL